MDENARAEELTLSLRASSSQSEEIFKALSNAVRLQILEFLTNRAATIAQISQGLQIPQSTVKQQINILERAELIETYLRPAKRGTEKVCSGIYKSLTFDLNPPVTRRLPYSEIAMPIGCFSDFDVTGPCGLATYTNIIGKQGEEDAFFEPDRVNAQLLWFTEGWLEYRFAKKVPPKARLTSLSVSMELCSEAPGFNLEWPSDLTVWVNDIEIGTWTSPGDFGGIRGSLTPAWWVTESSQYGRLKTWKITNEGCFIDDHPSASPKLPALSLNARRHIAVRVGLSPDAVNKGGLNLFGRQFGNSPQDIVLRLVYLND